MIRRASFLEIWHRLSGSPARRWPPPVGHVRLGDLESTMPVSLDFGFDRGLPIDRYYIEGFLERHALDIGGSVLEVDDDQYSRRFGSSRVTQQHVLDINPANVGATIIGDLTRAGMLPPNAYDCIILTQVLQLLFDLQPAIMNLRTALRPGGTLLLTVPGISQTDRGGARETWCWSFTRSSLVKLFSTQFNSDELEVAANGNVFAAVAFLHGLALAEVDRSKLDVFDEAYPVILTLRARKST
jgi:SAM-dependent methyltransferase